VKPLAERVEEGKVSVLNPSLRRFGRSAGNRHLTCILGVIRFIYFFSSTFLTSCVVDCRVWRVASLLRRPQRWLHMEIFCSEMELQMEVQCRVWPTVHDIGNVSSIILQQLQSASVGSLIVRKYFILSCWRGKTWLSTSIDGSPEFP